MTSERKQAGGPDSGGPAPVSLLVEYDTPDAFVYGGTEILEQGIAIVETSAALDAGTVVAVHLSFPGLREAIIVDGRVHAAAQDERTGVCSLVIAVVEDGGDSVLESAIRRVERRDPTLVQRVIRVLVVEDNPHVAKLIRDGLGLRKPAQDIAFSVAFAGHGQEALELIEEAPFDAVIADMYLPVMDGETFIATLRSQPDTASVPVLAVSAGGESARQAALTAGANHFIDKPMRLQQVLEALAHLLDIEFMNSR